MISTIFLLTLVQYVSGNCVNITVGNQVLCVANNDNKYSDDSKETPLGEVGTMIPPDDKGGVYYIVITMFVVSTFASTFLTGTFLVLSIILWSHFKQLEKLPVFHRKDTVVVEYYQDRAIGRPFIYIWLILVWVLSAIVVVSMMLKNCAYEYIVVTERRYVLVCRTESKIAIKPSTVVQTIELVIQFVVPIFILIIYIALVLKILKMKNSAPNKYEMQILKQAFAIFLLFQISSTVFLLCQTLRFEVATAFMIKRIINTTEIIAGAATPCFFFLTSKEIRKLVSVTVSTTSSQANSNNIQQRRQTLRST